MDVITNKYARVIEQIGAVKIQILKDDETDLSGGSNGYILTNVLIHFDGNIMILRGRYINNPEVEKKIIASNYS